MVVTANIVYVKLYDVYNVTKSTSVCGVCVCVNMDEHNKLNS